MKKKANTIRKKKIKEMILYIRCLSSASIKWKERKGDRQRRQGEMNKKKTN